MPKRRAAGKSPHRRLSVVTVVALAATLLQVPSGVFMPSAQAEQPAPQRDEASALKTARESGERVEVLSRRSQRQQLFANPSGTFTLESSVIPRFVRRSGEWVTADATLKVEGDTVVPRATVVDLAFSGGGTDTPLVRLALGANRLSLKWPGTLPTLSIG